MLRGNCIGPALIYFGEYLSKERGLTRQIVLLKASSVIVSISFTSESLFFWCLLISVLRIFRPICEWYLIIIRCLTPKIKHDLFYGSCYGWTVWQYKKYQPMPCMVATFQVHKNVATCMLINNATDLWLHVCKCAFIDSLHPYSLLDQPYLQCITVCSYCIMWSSCLCTDARPSSKYQLRWRHPFFFFCFRYLILIKII